jgi:hypothetical protein
MLRLLRSAVLAATLAWSSAHAVVVDMGADPVDESVINSFAAGVSSFSDTVLFSLSTAGGLVTTAFSNWPVPTAGLRGLTLELFQGASLLASAGPSAVVVPGGGIPAFTLESLTRTLAAGDYRLVLSGTVRPDGGFYAWNLSTTAVAPVPEPEQWAMLLSGMALVLGVVRRRRKAIRPV